MNMLQKRIKQLEAQHGGIVAAARVLRVTAPYLCRLASGEKDNPSHKLLKRMGLRRVVWFERLGPEPEPEERPEDDLLPDEWKAMYQAQCAATDRWADIAAQKADAGLLARIKELEENLAKVNNRLIAEQNKGIPVRSE